MKNRIAWLAALLPLALVLACSDANKIPAEAAIKAAESAVSSLGDVAMKYVPEQTQELQKGLADAKDLAAKKDYKGALAAAVAIPDKAKAVLAAANAKKDEMLNKEALTKTFGEVSAQIPNLLSALKSRLDILSQAKKLPAGLTKATLEQAKAGATDLESGLGAAQAQAQGGDVAGAIAKANELKAKGLEIMKSIGMGQ
jgi:hypothetical protein